MIREIYPFLEYAEQIGQEKGQIRVEDIEGYSSSNKDVLETDEHKAWVASHCLSQHYRVFCLEKVGTYILDADLIETKLLFNSGLPYIECVVVHLDYTTVVERMKFDEIGNKYVVSYPMISGSHREELDNVDHLHMFLDGTSLKRPVPISDVEEQVYRSIKNVVMMEGKELEEGSLDRFKGKKSLKVDSVDLESDVEMALRQYLKSDKVLNRVPLLLGLSGVAKSALVKSLCDELGYRIVDLRVGFMSRLDMNGITDIREVDGVSESLDCPSEVFVKCSDECIRIS